MGIFFEEFDDGLVFGGIGDGLAVVFHQAPASHTELLFYLFVSVLNICFAHRHVGFQSGGLEVFVLADAK